MDPRIREHAEIIVDHSASVGAGDRVVVSAPPVAHDLAVALHEAVGERGAVPVYVNSDKRAERAYLRAVDLDDIDTADHLEALYDASDAVIRVRADENATETSDVSPETNARRNVVNQPVQETVLSKRWTLTQFPAPGNAQLAGMSTEAYERFVYDAVNKDWDEQGEFQQEMVGLLDAAAEVRIVSGGSDGGTPSDSQNSESSGYTTDLTMSVEGMTTVNDTGKHNLPGGEVFTAPVADSVEGEVLFDKPLIHQSREIEGVFLRFEGGEVVEHSAEANEELLTEVLNTDEGARRLGELGIGMNRDIDRFTYNMLFDEKMGDTVHLAVGRAYEECGGENESAVHVDMIVDMSEDSRIELDGEVVQRDGTFKFEEGFED